MMSLHDQVLAEIEAFLARHGMAARKLGTSAMGDPMFVFRSRAGRQLKSNTIDRIRLWMAAYDKAHKAAPSRPTRRAGGNVRPAVAA